MMVRLEANSSNISKIVMSFLKDCYRSWDKSATLHQTGIRAHTGWAIKASTGSDQVNIPVPWSVFLFLILGVNLKRLVIHHNST